MDNANGSEGSGLPLTRARRRRSGKACQYCHARKVRCDIQQRGTPCSECVTQSIPCKLRKRKNARAGSFEADEPQLQHGATNGGHVLDVGMQQEPSVQETFINEPHSSPEGFRYDGSNQPVDWRPYQDHGVWNDASLAQNLAMGSGQTPSTVDFTYLTDLEDVFAFTDWSLLPGVQQPNMPPPPPLQYSYSDPNPAQLASDQVPSIDESSRIGLAGSLAPDANDHQYLRSQGCFTLPPVHIMRQIVTYYFRYVHPNLPVLDEYRFAVLWEQEDYRLDGFSFFVFRTMMFASIHFVDLDHLAILGYPSKQDARLDCLRKAKLVFDFALETDAVALAQGCLLLTYHAPGWNRLRVNGSWLMNASRFARIAQADTFHLVQDPIRKRTLKRIWWCILFRDRILSLGLRWRPQVPLNPRFESDEYFLIAEDFKLDLGRSKVHDQDSQLRIVDIMTSLCSLVCALTPTLQLLYGHERVRERIADISTSFKSNIAETQRCLEALHRWYDHAVLTFPAPISLDDTHESICIYANLLFWYHYSAVFALNLHQILIHETIPEARDRISLETCQEASVTAINDIGRRVQELVQTRLAQYLPISASAYIALPLLLQAVDVAAVRGTELETVEIRKLDVYSRVLRGQEQNFDGSQFCREMLSNIVAYVSNQRSFLEWIGAWRDERGNGGTAFIAARPDKPGKKTKLGWANLILKRPHLYLRLLLNLDYALCTGSAPKEEDLLPEILRSSSP